MQYLEIDEITPGMILAKEMMDTFERVITKSEMKLRNTVLEQMKTLGFAGAYIDEPESDGIYIGEILPRSMKIQAIQAIKDLNIDNAIFTAAKIVKYLRLNEKYYLDSLDLRTYDDYMVRHSVNVCIYSALLGAKVGISMKQLDALAGAAILHDAGYCYLDHRLLNSRKKFHSKEYEMVKDHVFFGVENLQINFSVTEEMLQAIAQHHENEDGSGYPEGLHSEEICKMAKIIHIVDVYDALLAKKPYRRAYRPDEAMNYLIENKGILFDEEYVDVFSKMVPYYFRGMKVTLSNGVTGIVESNHEEDFLRPKVRIDKYKVYDLFDPKWADVFILPPESIGPMEYLSPEDTLEKEKQLVMEKKAEEELVDKTEWEHILLVDDMVSIRKIFEYMLKDEYRITCVSSGEQAIEYLQENTEELPDLMIMDIHMTGMDGIETVRQIRETISEKIPVIFFSESCDENTIRECYDAGGTDFLAKPFKSLQVLDKIEEVFIRSTLSS